MRPLLHYKMPIHLSEVVDYYLDVFIIVYVLFNTTYIQHVASVIDSPHTLKSVIVINITLPGSTYPQCL